MANNRKLLEHLESVVSLSRSAQPQTNDSESQRSTTIHYSFFDCTSLNKLRSLGRQLTVE